jgi:neutral ceramidase
MIRRTIGVAVFCVLCPLWAFGADSDFQVGFGRRKITPTDSLWMSGYAGPERRADGVLDDLYAQAMAVRDGAGARALLLRVDVCTMRDATINQICELITQRTGLLRREVLVNVSHTHSGPAVDELYHYPMSTEDRANLAAYMERLKAMCADAAEDALKDLQPAVLEVGVGEAHFFHNRRGLDADGRYTGMQANPDNHADRDVPVLRVSATDGAVRGVVFGVACHNVTLGVNREYSGDYAGQARIQLERDIPNALFVTGCGADANPYRGSTGADLVRQHGVTLAKEVKRVMAEPMEPVRGPLKTEFRYVDLPLVTYATRADIEKMRRGPFADYGTVNRLLATLDRRARIPTTFSAPFAVWQFGDDLTLAGLPEETVSEYVPLLKKAIGSQTLWTAGYCNDVSSYLPTVRIMDQGGYETRGFIANTHAGWYARDAEQTLVEAVAKMVGDARQQVTEHSKPTLIETFAEWRFEDDAPHSGLKARGDVPRAERGLQFDGDSYLEGPSVDLPSVETKGLTMAAWIKPDPACMTGNRQVVCQWANEIGNDRFGFGLNDGKPSLGVGDGVTGEQGFTCDQTLRTDRWTFIAATWHPLTRQYRVYIDGKLTATTGTQTGSGINPGSQVTLKIGAQASEKHPRQFIGQIDDVWLGNALNPAGIEKLFESRGK